MTKMNFVFILEKKENLSLGYVISIGDGFVFTKKFSTLTASDKDLIEQNTAVRLKSKDAISADLNLKKKEKNDILKKKNMYLGKLKRILSEKKISLEMAVSSNNPSLETIIEKKRDEITKIEKDISDILIEISDLKGVSNVKSAVSRNTPDFIVDRVGSVEQQIITLQTKIDKLKEERSKLISKIKKRDD